jgi:hypothetical protein
MNAQLFKTFCTSVRNISLLLFAYAAPSTATFMTIEVKGMDASFMELAMVSRGRTATCRSIEECRTYEELRGNKVILPVC